MRPQRPIPPAQARYDGQRAVLVRFWRNDTPSEASGHVEKLSIGDAAELFPATHRVTVRGFVRVEKDDEFTVNDEIFTALSSYDPNATTLPQRARASQQSSDAGKFLVILARKVA
jgi:hypothetical protein